MSNFSLRFLPIVVDATWLKWWVGSVPLETDVWISTLHEWGIWFEKIWFSGHKPIVTEGITSNDDSSEIVKTKTKNVRHFDLRLLSKR